MCSISESFFRLRWLLSGLLLPAALSIISSCAREETPVLVQDGYDATCYLSVEGSKAAALSPLDVKSLAVLVFDASGNVESRLSVDPSSPGGTFFVPGPGRTVYAFANCGDMSFVSTLSDLDAICLDLSTDTPDPAYPPMSGSVSCPASLNEGAVLNVVLRSLLVKVTLGVVRNKLDAVFSDFLIRGIMLVRACSKVSYRGVGSVPLNVDGTPVDQCMIKLLSWWVTNGSYDELNESIYCCPTSLDENMEFVLVGVTKADMRSRFYEFSLKKELMANREYKINLLLENPGLPTIDTPRESGMFDVTVGIPGWGNGTEIDAEI